MLIRNLFLSVCVAALAGSVSQTAFAQGDDTETPASPAEITDQIVIDDVDIFLDDALSALVAEADAGDGAAALAVAKARFASESPEEQRQGVDYLISAHEAGASEATLMLANLYESGGYGMLPDLEQAEELYGIAIENGSIDAKVSLGRLLVNTSFSAADKQRGLTALEEAHAAGSISAANFLADLYSTGRAVPIDTQTALDYYSFGLASGNTTSLLAVGDMLRTGAFRLPARPDLAMTLFERAIANGQVSATYRIADMYIRGEAVEQDIEFGMSMLTALANSGDDDAYIALGDLYARAEILPPDFDQAVAFYQQAAETSPTGYLRLAGLYLEPPVAMPPEPRRAVEYYETAAEMGSTTALRSLADLYLEGRVLAPNPQRAFDLLDEAVSFGDGTAATRLAILHANNEPFPADFDAVQRYLSLALAMGNSAAIIDVSTAIAEGPLVRTVRDDAYNWLRSAAESGLPGAASRLARLQLDGLFPAESLSGVIEMVRASANSGDKAAARFIIGLYRDGYGLLMSPDLAAAQDYVDQYAPLLGPEETTIEQIRLEASRGQSLEVFETILAQYKSLTPATSITFLDQLRQENDRAFVFVVQSELTEEGLFAGVPNGTMDGLTIQSFNAACAAANAMTECLPGPMTGATARVIGRYIWGPRPAS
ncbi:tetratricopeptide repeat protein [Pelagibacterium luteolum]|uniref:TPR repeat n=1 Tax=Pelagibacterium luteolum TaxID=440168 RepID=A0A1G7S1J1_9HYPH|nr:tetratricopeptide repeat protein [Pelagibacterium luteolum]SDG16902.1 TPR repeat [Pelagibacterium luteolum]